MPAFDSLQLASFEGIKFPIGSCEITGSIRDHIHIYPHAKGGSPEKMGRNLYLIKMEANFQDTFKKYPNLWPYRLADLRKYFENETTGKLVIPTIGTIKAYCRNWTQKMEARIRSGEKCNFEFVEDQDATVLSQSLQQRSAVSIAESAKAFNAAKALADFQDDSKAESIFDAITNVANYILSFRDMAELAGNLVSAKVLALADLCKQFQATNFADSPRNEPVINAFANLYDTVLRINDDFASKQTKVEIYVVPTTVSMNQISQKLYGDTSHTVELMQMNAVDDVFQVRAGTSIKFYPAQVGNAGYLDKNDPLTL